MVGVWEVAYGDYEWYLKQDLSRYNGKWVAIYNKRVVASSKDLRKLFREFKKKYPDKTPLLARIDGNIVI